MELQFRKHALYGGSSVLIQSVEIRELEFAEAVVVQRYVQSGLNSVHDHRMGKLECARDQASFPERVPNEQNGVPSHQMDSRLGMLEVCLAIRKFVPIDWCSVPLEVDRRWASELTCVLICVPSGLNNVQIHRMATPPALVWP